MQFLGDASKYQQVLLNVLSNAVRFSPLNSTIEVKISYTIVNCQPELEIEGQDSSRVLLSVIVQDAGPGINESDQKKLFKPFTTLKRQNKINPNGVGIGLYVCKVICEKLGGDICCFSDGQGCGATFEFRIQMQETSWPRLADVRNTGVSTREVFFFGAGSNQSDQSHDWSISDGF